MHRLLVVPATVAALTRWVSPGVLSGVGFVIAAAGLQWLGHAGVGGPKLNLVLPMIVIGIGVGMPWGVMDGLAISVVPKERAGMATGVFNSARVAGEGGALAIVSALLANLSHSSLAKLLGAEPISSAGMISGVSQRIATGDIYGAAAIVPQQSCRSNRAAAYTLLVGFGLRRCLSGVDACADW